MIIKKLAAPLVNEKILHEAEHCYIATTSISEAAFDFIKSRLPPKCKIEIVTGLDEPTSPQVFQRILKHYQGRITLNIYTKNFFHANAYIFDLPYRKSVAFIGSGHCTLGGLKDNEEIFYKIKDPKEIEALKSWFTGYYEFSEPLTEAILEEYEWIYPSLKQREIESRQEKKHLIELTASGFQWDTIKFKNQYFKKEDYLVLGNAKASLNTPEIQAERTTTYNKLLALHESIRKDTASLKLLKNTTDNHTLCSLNPLQHTDQKLQSMWISYCDVKQASDEYSIPGRNQRSDMQLQIILKPKEFGIWLLPGKKERRYFYEQMSDATYRNTFYKLLTKLKIDGKGNDHWFYIAGEKRTIGNFQNEDAFWDFTKADEALQFDFIIGKTYMPGAIEINADIIATTITKEVEKMELIYQHIKMPG